MSNTLFRVLFFASFIFIGSCTKGKGGITPAREGNCKKTGSLESNVDILVLPWGKDDALRPRAPRLSYSPEGEELSCRPNQPDLRDIEGVEGLKVISKLLLEKEEQEQEENQEGNQRAGRDEPVNVTVQGGWIKLAFFINNANTGVDKNYILRIDRLEIHGNGNCEREGQPPCVFHRTISSGCGLPFLYLLPPCSSVNYKPLESDPLQNMTVYVDNIPVIDASVLPERENRLPGGATLILPKYEITVLFIGGFLLETGQTIKPFRKRIRFNSTRRQAF
ncbi:MAG: hypothetical protein OXB86_01780 [Bdellovibrionales bacterium]|nr:hypothetical protein [Bdellovibrionales bacterium]